MSSSIRKFQFRFFVGHIDDDTALIEAKLSKDRLVSNLASDDLINYKCND